MISSKNQSGFFESASRANPRLGLRWQGEAATPLSSARETFKSPVDARACESGVALRFPPQSKTRSVSAGVFKQLA